MPDLLLDLPLLLATEEGIPGTHIASTIVPIIGFIFFSGSVFVLLWSNYGWKKGGLIYGTAFFAFATAIGVFWWFGAPGTPIATGLTYFPGQSVDHYQGKWFPMEPGSERAEYFQVTNDLDAFQTPAEFVGMANVPPEELEDDPRYDQLIGDLSPAVDRMLSVYFPTSESGAPLLGQQRRRAINDKIPDPSQVQGLEPASPFLSARVKPREDDPDEPEILVARDRGLRVAGAKLQIVASYVPPGGAPEPQEFVIEEANFYAFKDSGAIWFPSAVWTAIAAVAFGACLFGLDRIEQREKERTAEREPVPA
ncbi:MAG: hypothetical protein M3N17_03675 [Actinomycetota bacterium]|nr:hypothetical protein [Actinomycetota bacterium]